MRVTVRGCFLALLIFAATPAQMAYSAGPSFDPDPKAPARPVGERVVSVGAGGGSFGSGGRSGGAGRSGGRSGRGGSGGGGPDCWYESGRAVDVLAGPLELKPASSSNWLYEVAPEGKVWQISHCLHSDGHWVNAAALADAAPPSGGGVAPVVVPVDPAGLALRATARLRFGFPGLGLSPPGAQVVGFPMWVWVDQSSWGPQVATDVDGGLSVTLTATPVTVLFDPGDGSGVVDCRGPGVVFDPGRHDGWAKSPSCGHTYTDVPSDGTVETVTKVVWEFAWVASDGRTGTLPDLVVAHRETFAVRAYTAITD